MLEQEHFHRLNNIIESKYIPGVTLLYQSPGNT